MMQYYSDYAFQEPEKKVIQLRSIYKRFNESNSTYCLSRKLSL